MVEKKAKGLEIKSALTLSHVDPLMVRMHMAKNPGLKSQCVFEFDPKAVGIPDDFDPNVHKVTGEVTFKVSVE